MREKGAQNGCILAVEKGGKLDKKAALKAARAFPGLKGMDLAKVVTTRKPYVWDEGLWELGKGYAKQEQTRFHVVAYDYGIKRNILRMLAARGCRLTVVPAQTPAEEVLKDETGRGVSLERPGRSGAVRLRHRGDPDKSWTPACRCSASVSAISSWAWPPARAPSR